MLCGTMMNRPDCIGLMRWFEYGELRRNFSIECGSLMTRKNVHAYFAPHEAKYLSLIVQGASRDADWMAGNSSDKIGYMYAYLSTNRPIAWWGDNKRCSPEMAASWKPGFVCRTISDEEFEKSDENIWLVDDTDAVLR